MRGHVGSCAGCWCAVCILVLPMKKEILFCIWHSSKVAWTVRRASAMQAVPIIHWRSICSEPRQEIYALYTFVSKYFGFGADTRLLGDTEWDMLVVIYARGASR